MQGEVKALGQIRLGLTCPVHPVQLPRHDERGVECINQDPLGVGETTADGVKVPGAVCNHVQW
jgi:hypothetical protein